MLVLSESPFTRRHEPKHQEKTLPSIQQIYQSKKTEHERRSHWYPSEEFISVRPLRTKKKRWYLNPAAFHSSHFSYHIKRLVTSKASSLALGGTSLEKDNITVLNDVVLALGHDLALGLDLSLSAKLLERLVVVDDDLNESLLEVTVDDTSGLRRLGTVADGPHADLIRTSSEEGSEVEDLAHGDNDLGQGRGRANLLAFLRNLLVVLELGKTLLKGGGNGKNAVTRGMLLDPCGDLGKVLVLLSDVVALAEVDEVDDGLGGEEEHGVDGLDLCGAKSAYCTGHRCDKNKGISMQISDFDVLSRHLCVKNEVPIRRAGIKEVNL